MFDYHKYEALRPEFHPVRHRKKDLYSVDVKIISGYREKIRKIQSLDSLLNGYMLSLNDYKELVLDAYAVNVHWSTKIEGNKLSLEEVRKSSKEILNSKSIIAHNPGPKQEIINHLYSYYVKDLMRLPWSLSTVEAVHRFLMNGTGEDCVPGRIRENEEMNVVNNEGEATFIACPAIHVRTELEELMRWVNDSPYDPLVTSVVFFHEYESIHPFTEGNGRTGRTLFHVLMQELGFRRFNLCKLEDKLLSNSAVYYSLLEYTDETGNYTPLTEYFIDCIEAAYEEAVSDYSQRDLLREMDEDTRKIAMRARELMEWFTIADAMGWTRGLTEQSIRARLSSLVDKGVLEKEGRTRSTRFRFSDPFRSLKETVLLMND